MPIERAVVAALLVVMLGTAPAFGTDAQQPGRPSDGASAPRRDRIAVSVDEELRRHPEATLVDLYKFFFQGAHGPGHLIPDRETARAYLERELATAERFDNLLWQPVGYEERFYRLNLSLVANGTLPFDAFVDAFVGSANDMGEPTIVDWRAEWAEILDVIEASGVQLPDVDADRDLLDRRLRENRPLVRHSERFRAAHHPHYRLVDAARFAELKEQYLSHLAPE